MENVKTERVNAVYRGELLPCPLCGKPVEMKLEGCSNESLFREEIDFNVRGKIKCECFLTLDIGQFGVMDGDKLIEYVKRFGDEVASRWNTRANV